MRVVIFSLLLLLAACAGESDSSNGAPPDTGSQLPTPTDPEPTDPEPTDPEPTDPGPNSSLMCVSGFDGNKFLNGEYSQAGTNDGKPYYTKPLAADCNAGEVSYLFYSAAHGRWIMAPEIGMYANSYCLSGEHSTPDQCLQGDWYNLVNNTTSPEGAVVMGACPQINCSSIQISSSANDVCDGLYNNKVDGQTMSRYNNSLSRNIYLQFVPELNATFCTDTPTDSCSITAYDQSNNSLHNLSNTESSMWEFNFSKTQKTVTCLE